MTAALLMAASVLLWKYVDAIDAGTHVLFALAATLGAVGIFLYVVIRLLTGGAW